MSLAQEAERAHGPDFVPKATLVSLRLGVPLDWPVSRYLLGNHSFHRDRFALAG